MTCVELEYRIASRIFADSRTFWNLQSSQKSANVGIKFTCLRTCFAVIHFRWKFVWFPCNVGINLGRPGASEFKKINYWKMHRSCRFPICIERTVLQAGNHLYWYNFLKYQLCFFEYYFYPLLNMAWIWHTWFLYTFGTLLMELYFRIHNERQAVSINIFFTCSFS